MSFALLLVVIGGLAGLLEWQPAVRRAADLAGERWYRITLNQQQIGYLHSVSERNWLGRWQFETDLRFVLQPGQPVRIRQHLEFAALPPFALLEAGQWSERAGSATDASRLTRGAAGYRWQRSTAGDRAAPELSANWSFGLADYLAFETWLHETAPSTGTVVTLPTLDFSRQELVPKRYRVTAHTASGWQVENPAPNEATSIRLDPQLRPTHMSLAGLFDLELVPQAVALAPRTALQAASYHVPVDRPLHNHTQIRHLRLAVEGSPRPAELWPALTDRQLGELVIGSNTLSGLPLEGDELQQTEQHPVGDSRIRQLARRAVADAQSPLAQTVALTGFVHTFITYRENAPPQPVLALLDTPEGNCNQYADLLTTLARSLGIPARTVFGLAYADIAPPAFRFHAWNELLIDGRWIAVDPTWNQTDIDATHIPMPLSVATALQLLTGGGSLRFVVRQVGY